MSGTESFNRIPRIQEALPQGTIKLPAPPPAPPTSPLNWTQWLLPLAGALVMIGIYGGMRGDWRLALPMVALSLISTLTAAAGQWTQRRHRQRETAEKAASYAAALAQKRSELEALSRQHQRIRTNTDPDLETLMDRARRRDPRLWERTPGDDDFLRVRLGIGDLPSTVTIAVPHPEMPDPRLQPALALEREFATVPQVPLTASLAAGALRIAGPLPVAGPSDEQ